jgi:hypothetical protein
MANIELDLYLSQMMKFFEENPNELKTLIGECDKALFFDKIKEQCFLNLEKGEDIILTQTQLIDIVRGLVAGGMIITKQPVDDVELAVQETSFGRIYLN